jgi:hypothetical protein
MSPITLTLCHGTDSEFQGFNVNECNECGAFGRGFYFSNDFELERVYSDGLDPVVAKVTLQNPYILDGCLPHDEYLAASRIFRPVRHARERLIGLGYDGVVLRQDSHVETVAFYPSQIHSYGRRPDFPIPNERKLQKILPFFQLWGIQIGFGRRHHNI